MDIREINNVFEVMGNISSKVMNKKHDTPGTMNIAEIMNRHHLENQHSNIISFLIDPEEIHNHPEYGTKFLDLLKKKGLNITGEKICNTVREDSTDDFRRIDIFVETENEYIIIENKVYADDQDNQIHDYIEYVKEKYSADEKVFVVYLNPRGYEPSEKSISPEELANLKNEKRFITLSYSDDILNWLGQLEFKKDEDVLKAGIVQYIDVVQAITNKRKEVFKMNEEIANELFYEYGKLSREELKEKLHLMNSFQDNINLTLFINFFEEIYKEGKGKLKFLCNGNSNHENTEAWEKDVIQNRKRFGIRYSFNNHEKDLFVTDLNSNDFIYASNTDKIGNEYGDTINVDGYKFAKKIKSNWFNAAILNNYDEKKFEEKKLSSHVVRSWFGIK